MNKFRTTTVKPLMVNFITPKAIEETAPVSIVYDAQKGITYLMGGGDSTPRATRCNDYDTQRETRLGPNYTEQDYDRYTDD
jgi:hypothetical protein